MNGGWVSPDTRDAVTEFVNKWSEKTELPVKQFITWLGIHKSKFYHWHVRYGKVNEHNGKIPRDFWLQDSEKKAILDFEQEHPDEGYRRLTYMMMDNDVVAASPASVWRVLSAAGRLEKWNKKPSKKGTGFVQPLKPHEHWHIDVSYINICGTFYYLCSILDGCSRYIVDWEIGEQMTETDIEILMQRAKESYPDARPRIISDNGPQFIANDFKSFIRMSGMTHVRTSPYYPQSNGKIERWHKSYKAECIRPATPLSLDDAKRLTAGYVVHYNCRRLHSAIGYISPQDKLQCREQLIFDARARKLHDAREQRKSRTKAAA